MSQAEVYVSPRAVTDLRECLFYHTIDIPGHGLVEGEWDLRSGIRDYLGGVDLSGKRVLEVGTASGFVCFEMERLGAEVVAFDLGEGHTNDRVPFATRGAEREQDIRAQLRRLDNAFWLCHGAFGSRTRKVHGTAGDIPGEIGPVDVATFGCVLLHLREPFQALASAARLTRETLIVTEPLQLRRWQQWLLNLSGCAALVFLPRAARPEQNHTWWQLSPGIVQRFLEVLGFAEARVTYHWQRWRGQPRRLFTVVARRTQGRVEL